MKIKTLGIAVTLACLPFSSAEAADQLACSAALAALAGYVHPTERRAALERMGNLQRVKLWFRMAGVDCLMQAYGPNRECGWTVVADETPPVQPPSKEAVQAFVAAPTSDATAKCPKLARAMLAFPGWREAPEVRLRPNRHGLYPVTLVSITLPVLAPSQNEAIAWLDSQSGRLAGSSNLVLLRRTDSGAWRVTAVLPVSVS